MSELPENSGRLYRSQWKQFTDDLRSRVEKDPRFKNIWADRLNRQQRERDQLDRERTEDINRQRRQVIGKYKPAWREMEKLHGTEQRFAAAPQTGARERAEFILRNAKRLFSARVLTPKNMLTLIHSAREFGKALRQLHERERGMLSTSELAACQATDDMVKSTYQPAVKAMDDRHTEERERVFDYFLQSVPTAEVQELQARARDTPGHEDPQPALQFNEAASVPASWPTRAEQIRQEMQAWLRDNADRDKGREL